jgi:hypothetical protein
MPRTKDRKWTWRYGFCVYCGELARTQRRVTNTEPITCTSCRDLPQVDPQYAEPLDQWADAR